MSIEIRVQFPVPIPLSTFQHSTLNFVPTIDAHPALQDQLTGTEKGTNVVFLHTTVDDGDHFQTINAWTIKSRWKQQNQLLREVTASFRSEK